MLTAEDLFGGAAVAPIEVQPPGSSKPVRLRYPTFSEWYELVSAQRKLDGKDPPAELIARTVATCIAAPDGSRRLTDQEAAVLLTSSAAPVVWLYRKCWETVLADNDATVQEEAKN